MSQMFCEFAHRRKCKMSEIYLTMFCESGSRLRSTLHYFDLSRICSTISRHVGKFGCCGFRRSTWHRLVSRYN